MTPPKLFPFPKTSPSAESIASQAKAILSSDSSKKLGGSKARPPGALDARAAQPGKVPRDPGTTAALQNVLGAKAIHQPLSRKAPKLKAVRDPNRRVTEDDIHQRWTDANGQPLITIYARHIRNSRIANDLLPAKLKAQGRSLSELFITSSLASRNSLKFGEGLEGEYWSQVLIAENVRLGKDVNLLGHGGIEIHSGVVIGDGVNLDTIGHPKARSLHKTAILGGPIVIEEGAQIGANATIVTKPGHPLVIGRGARIGNNAVVLESVAPNTVVQGCPAEPCRLEDVHFSLEAPPFEMPPDFVRLDNAEQAKALMGENFAAAYPVFIRGREFLTLEGDDILGMNKRAIIDLKGPLTVKLPLSMATDSRIEVESGAHLETEPGAFVYMQAHLTAKADSGGLRRVGENAIIGAGARITADVPDNRVVVGENELKGGVDDRDDFESFNPEWEDPKSLPRNLIPFNAEKRSHEERSVEQLQDMQIASFVQLMRFRTRPYPAEAVLFQQAHQDAMDEHGPLPTPNVKL